MESSYRVPKRTVRARVRQLGSPERDVDLHLGALSASHAGQERPSDLLRGGERFLAAVDVAVGDAGGFVLLSAASILSVTVPADVELSPEVLPVEDLAAALAVTRTVELTLVDGAVLRGTVAYLLAEGRRRVRDFLDETGPTLTLRDGDSAHVVVVNKIASVRPLDEPQPTTTSH